MDEEYRRLVESCAVAAFAAISRVFQDSEWDDVIERLHVAGDDAMPDVLRRVQEIYDANE